jgi:hypothetical protein
MPREQPFYKNEGHSQKIKKTCLFCYDEILV